jgi:DNA replication protein DnaC
MKELNAQTIDLYSKQLRTPMFNSYTDVIRQLDQNQSYEDFLIQLMKLELDSRQESTRRRKIQSAGFPYIKTMDELDCSRFEHMNEAFVKELASCDFVAKKQNIVMIGNPGTGNYRKYLVIERNESIVIL